MRRRALASAASSAAVVLVAACRGLVGIEAVELVDAATDASVDPGPTETRDAGADAPPGPDTPDASNPAIAACANGTECRKCCKAGFPGLREAETLGRACLCSPDGGCGACLGQPYCAGTGNPPPSCAPCIDDKLIRGECTETCTSAACQEGLACIRACP